MNNNNLSPYLNIFKSDTICNIIPEKELPISFPYKLDNFQKESIYRIHNGENVLICAHTGSGKTVAAIYSIAHNLKNNKFIIYTSPIKALSNQKYAEFIKLFGKDSVSLLTGDQKINPDGNIIIMTTEILRNILYKHSNNESSIIDMKNVGSVIFDEVHYINNSERGYVYEESIALLPREINLVMLSATIDQPEIFASWIGNIKQVPINLIQTFHRVVPLTHYFWKYYIFDNNGKDEIHFELCQIMDNNNNFKNYDLIKRNYRVFDINKLMDKLVDYLVDENLLPALFFKFSRKKCETICKYIRRTLLTIEQITEVENIFNFHMRDYRKIYEILPQYQDVYAQLKKGIVYHHSGLIPILKEIIEIIYCKGLVKILIATETFSIGVNSPTKTVIFTEIEKFDNDGSRILRTDEYLQMAGRAGRRGLDKVGTVIILPTFQLPSELTFKGMLKGNLQKLTSKFKLSYQFVLKTLNSQTFNTDDFLSKTFISNENDKRVIGITSQKYQLEDKLKELETTIDQKESQNIINYEKIVNRLSDKLFTIKKKDKDKMEKDKKVIESNPNFKSNYETFKKIKELKKELNDIDIEIWNCNNQLKDDIDKMVQLLKREDYIETKKGIVAMEINECNELVFTEMIFRGILDNLTFPEIVSILSSFINEKDSSNGERYINDLDTTDNVIKALKEIEKIGIYYQGLEDEHKIYIGTDYKIYMDFIETSYIWASGGTIADVYRYTQIYDGNFVKAIMRISNICENLMDICKSIERYDICSKLEGFNEKLIRDITGNNSLYVK
jgi:superfamily II RNA helicase